MEYFSGYEVLCKKYEKNVKSVWLSETVIDIIFKIHIFESFRHLKIERK